MRKLLQGISCLLLLSLASFVSTAETIHVFGYDSKPPKYYTEDNVNKGILIDIMAYAGKQMNVEFEVNLLPWPRAVYMANKGYGAILGFSITAERKKSFDYSDVVFWDEVYIVVKKDKKFTFNTVDDLKDKIGALVRGARYGQEFEEGRKNNKLKIVWTNSVTQRLLLVLRERVDYTFVPGVYGLDMALKNDEQLLKYKNEFFILPIPIFRDSNHLAFSKSLNMRHFLNKFDQVIKTGYQSGAIDKIIHKNSPHAK